jgi:hypothetical protein
MKKISLFCAVIFAAMLISPNAKAQTLTLQGATPHAIALSWTAPVASGGWLGCTAGSPCTYAPYALVGATCPAVLVGSTGWTALSTVNSTTATDSGQTPGSIVSYVVYTMQGGNQSTPSNCITVTVPLDPLPPTGLQG